MAHVSVLFLLLNKILDARNVGSPAFTPRSHHPEAQLAQFSPVGGKADNDASRLRPVLTQWRRHGRVVSPADLQLHATEVLQLALGEDLELALRLELKFHADVV